MTKRNWIIGGFAVLLFLLAIIYFFFPSNHPTTGKKQSEKQVSFLEVDTKWADSLLKTLSIEEKAGMLIMYQSDQEMDSSSSMTEIPGAYLLSSSEVLDMNQSKSSARSLFFAKYDQVPLPFLKNKNSVTPENNTIIPNAEIFFALKEDSILNESQSLLIKAADYFHLDGLVLPELGEIMNRSKLIRVFHKDSANYRKRISFYSMELTNENVLSGSIVIGELNDELRSSTRSDSVLDAQILLNKSNLPVIWIDSQLTVKKMPPEQITNYLKKKLNFNGLCISYLKKKDLTDEKVVAERLLAGSDMLVTHNFSLLKMNLINLIRQGKLDERLINAKVKKILLAKTWCKLKRKRLRYEPVKSFSVYEKSFPRRIRKASFTLVKNEKGLLPIRNITSNRMAVIHIGHQPSGFVQQLYHYLPKEQTVPVKIFKTDKEIGSFNGSDFKKYNTVILTINRDMAQDISLIEKIKILSNSTKLIILNFEFPDNLSALNKFSTIIQFYGNSKVETDFGAQAVMGAVTMNTDLPYYFNSQFKLNKTYTLGQSRLQYTIPEDIGISSDSLLKINYIVEEGIRNKAFPGAQVFFALDGKVFFNQAFGTHTYADKQEVKVNDLFDMASVTKVAASTIVAMSTYEKGLYRLNDSLYKHLPDTLKKHIRGKSTLRNITFKQILIHATGLAAGQPIIKYIRYRDSLIDKRSRFDKYYCDYSDKYYKILVADGFYMEREQEDSIWYAMNRMSVDENPSYRYSDANMNLLYKLLNAKIKNRWQYYLDSLFYKPLGMFNTYYLPIQNEIEPERIVPTENDRYWRKQLLRGYVHDPTAALFGGVAGNAGLFSTAEDMGILFQMLMYKGLYGGNQYFKKETVDLFISQQSGSHRGLGFNRQVKGNTYGVSPYASNNTFGHTGFTGISVWADMDINLLYVSCTNRVHPDADNKKIIQLGTTKRIHNVIYEQLKYLMPDKIDLNR